MIKLHTNTKKLIVFTALVLLFFSWWSLRDSGFCFSRGKYLSEIELLDSALFADKAGGLSESAKIKLAGERGLQYPNCCSVNDGPPLLPPLDKFINKVIVKFPFVLKKSYRNLNPGYEKNPYSTSYSALDACGNISKPTYTSFDRKDEYESNIEWNRKIWEQAK